MERRALIAAVVLAAFAGTIAVPGPPVVAHRHADGAHAHAHDVHEHAHGDGRPHRHLALDAPADRDGAAAARRRAGDGLFAWDGATAAHAHLVAPFQPATVHVATPAIGRTHVRRVAAARPLAPPAPGRRGLRARAPPPARV